MEDKQNDFSFEQFIQNDEILRKITTPSSDSETSFLEDFKNFENDAKAHFCMVEERGSEIPVVDLKVVPEQEPEPEQTEPDESGIGLNEPEEEDDFAKFCKEQLANKEKEEEERIEREYSKEDNKDSDGGDTPFDDEPPYDEVPPNEEPTHDDSDPFGGGENEEFYKFLAENGGEGDNPSDYGLPNDFGSAPDESPEPDTPESKPADIEPTSSSAEEDKRKSIEERRNAEKGKKLLNAFTGKRSTKKKEVIEPKPKSEKPPKPNFKFGLDKKTTLDLRLEYERNQATKFIDGVEKCVSSFSQNKQDITDNMRAFLEQQMAKEQEDKRKAEAEKKQISLPMKEDNPENGEIPKSSTPQEQEVRGNEPTPASVPTEPSEPIVVTDKKQILSADEKNAQIQDKDNTEIEDKPKELKRIRTYSRGKAPREKAKYNTPKVFQTDYKKPIVTSILLALSVGLFLGMKANSYCLYTKQKTTSLFNCIFQGIINKKMETVLLPFTNVFWEAFLLGAGIVGFIAFNKISEMISREKRREGHEHGNAHFITPKDFNIFQKNFMDMSASEKTSIKQKK